MYTIGRLFAAGAVFMYVLIACLAIEAANTPAGTKIPNMASIVWQSPDGIAATVLSNNVETVVTQKYALELTAAVAELNVDPGKQVTASFTLTNRGNGPDSFLLAARTDAGWPVVVRKSGQQAPEETGETGVMQMDESIQLQAEVSVPVTATDGMTVILELNASSLGDPLQKAAATVALKCRRAVMTLVKSVDKASAAIGDTLTYTLTYSNAGSLAAFEVAVQDELPLNADFVAGSLRLNGQALSTVPDQSGRLIVDIGEVAAGASGTITFRAVVK